MRKIIIRYLGYAAVVAAGAVGVLLMAQYYPASLAFEPAIPGAYAASSEFSLIELLQNLLLLICACAFGWIASRDRLRRPMTLGFVALFSILLLRELDLFFDHYVIANFWLALSVLILSVTLVYVGRNRQRLVQAWRRSWPSAGLAIVMAGLILLLAYVQVIGRKVVLQAVMGDAYEPIVNAVVDELMELAAYVVITIGTMEFLYAWSRLPRTRILHERRRH